MAESKINRSIPIVKQFKIDIVDYTEHNYYSAAIDVSVNGLTPVGIVGISSASTVLYFWKLVIKGHYLELGISQRDGQTPISGTLTINVMYI